MEKHVTDFKKLFALANKLWQPPKGEFSILMPPPNVSGKLHIGHFLTYSLQDYFARKHKGMMLPGLDHGGISTFYSAKKAKNLDGLSTPEVTEAVKEFASECKTNIMEQMNIFGLCKNDQYLTYTMDPEHSKLVTETFIKFYNQGLITREKTIVNYDPKLKTVISDLEIEHMTQNSKLYYIEYEINHENKITVATTRPNTIFADVALGVNPKDERYKDFIGMKAKVPIINREIPIIASHDIDMEFGSGVLKITPAHDMTDWKIGQTNNLQPINIINNDGNFTTEELGEFEDIFSTLGIMDNMNLQTLHEIILNKVSYYFEPITQTIPVGSKTKVPIEYKLELQWFMNMKSAAKLALEVVESGELKIYPDRWVNNYKHWLNNIEPWCISRTVPWGHVMPVYYQGHEVYVGEEPPQGFVRTNEVFDTWFSSALWPMIYGVKFDIWQTDMLITAYDILFFWVARMVMMHMLLVGKSPFKQVFIHGLVRDECGLKMSKTVGNVIDPVDVIDEYGVDVVRLCLFHNINGQIRISNNLLEDSKCIITKIWNAGNFILNYQPGTHNTAQKLQDELIIYFEHLLWQWETNPSQDVSVLLNDLINGFYEFCQWFVEAVKIYPSLLIKAKELYKRFLWNFYPFIPFTTTWIYHEIYENNISIDYATREAPIGSEAGKLTTPNYGAKNHCQVTSEYLINFQKAVKVLRYFNKLNIMTYMPPNPDFLLFQKLCNVSLLNDPNLQVVDLYSWQYALGPVDMNSINKQIKRIQAQILNLHRFFQTTNEKTPPEIMETKTKELQELTKEKENLATLSRSL